MLQFIFFSTPPLSKIKGLNPMKPVRLIIVFLETRQQKQFEGLIANMTPIFSTKLITWQIINTRFVITKNIEKMKLDTWNKIYVKLKNNYLSPIDAPLSAQSMERSSIDTNHIYVVSINKETYFLSAEIFISQ